MKKTLASKLYFCLRIITVSFSLITSLQAQQVSDYPGTEAGLSKLVTDIANHKISPQFIYPTSEIYGLAFTDQQAKFLKQYNQANRVELPSVPVIQSSDRVVVHIFSQNQVLEFSDLFRTNPDNPLLENHPAAAIGLGYIRIFNFTQPDVLLGRVEIIRQNANEADFEEVFHEWFFVKGRWHWISLPLDM